MYLSQLEREAVFGLMTEPDDVIYSILTIWMGSPVAQYVKKNLKTHGELMTYVYNHIHLIEDGLLEEYLDGKIGD